MTDDHRQKPADLPGHDRLLKMYESAWSRWRPGAAEPSPSEYLQQVPRAEWELLQATLQSIADRYRLAAAAGDVPSSPPTAETLPPGETPGNSGRLPGRAPELAVTGSDTASANETLAPPGAAEVPTSSAARTPSGLDKTEFLEPVAAGATGASQADSDATIGPVAVGLSDDPTHKTGRGASRFDDYDIIDELGRGGMGVVYRAREISTQRVVCIKMMLGGEYASPEALRRFQVETEAAANLDHPHIVPIYRAGEVKGVPFFVMKYVEGKGMDRMPRDHFQNNPREAIQLMSTICRAVHFAHARGILHRDLKPANILLDTHGEPHITDFGLAKKIDDDAGQTRTGTIMGTPDYMSPEQAAGRNELVTVTSDVYSLGSMLFDLLTGQPPFKSATIMETLTRVTNEPARIPRVPNQRIGRDLETICLKCLEKDPNKRFRSAAAMADELDRYLRGEPIESRPVGSAERLWRWCRRNPVPAALSGLLLLLLLTAAIGSSLAAYQINIRKNEAVNAQRKAETAQRLADENALVANQQRTLALDTLHSLVTNVESKLRDRADLAELQTEILQDALRGLQEVSRTAENSGKTDRTVGVARQRMADILEKLGKTEEATEQHRQAIAIFEPLFAAHPDDDWAKWNAAISYDKLGDRSLGTDVAEASGWYRKSTTLREQLAAQRNEEKITATMRQHALAISAARVGGLALAQGDPKDALTYFRTALAQSEAMLKANAEDRQAQMAVAGSCTLLGNVSFRLGNQKEAHEYYHRALDMRLAILQRDPQSVSAKDLLAKSYDALGDFELQTGQTRDAHEYYQEAVKLVEELLEKDKSNAAVKSSLATLYYKLATAQLQLDDSTAAAPNYARCLALREELTAADPVDPQKQIALMLAHARCGHHQPAAEIADRLSKEAADNAGTLFYVACGYALSAGAIGSSEDAASLTDEMRALREKYTQLATDTLERAAALGYRDAVSMETDPDLEPVRESPAFQRLLVEMKKNPH